MSRIPRHVSSRVYVAHSETCKQPSVDLVHISECEIHGGPYKETNPETLTRKFLQLLKQRSKKDKSSVNQSAISFHSSRLDMSRYLNLK